MRRTATCLALASLVWLAPAPTAQPARPAPRAAWLWNPAPALDSDAHRTTLFDVLAREGVGTIWAQISTDVAAGPALSTPSSRGHVQSALKALRRADEWRHFLADAHRRGLKVEALDGDPTWALMANHAAPLGIVDAVISYNLRVTPAERFDGVHLDIEPYVLLSWRFPRSREQLLRELIDLATHCQTHVRDVPGMVFGMDIPYWWGSIDDRTGRPIGDTLFGGTRKAASEHLIDRLDNIGIMNYRNTAAGTDGMISNGTPVLTYADRARHAKIWMGVETSLSDPSEVWFIVGPPTEVVDARLENPDSGVGTDGRFFGFKVSVSDDGENTHLGLRAPDGMGDTPSPAFVDALVHLGRRFSASADRRFAATAQARRDRAMWSIGRDPEWRNLRARSIRDERDHLDYLGFVATSIMLPKITFAGLPASTLRHELAAAEAAFASHPSFAGMALHHVESLRTIVETDEPARALCFLTGSYGRSTRTQ